MLYFAYGSTGMELGFTSIQIPSETGLALLTLRVDAQKSCVNDLTISTLIAGSLLEINEQLV